MLVGLNFLKQDQIILRVMNQSKMGGQFEIDWNFLLRSGEKKLLLDHFQLAGKRSRLQRSLLLLGKSQRQLTSGNSIALSIKLIRLLYYSIVCLLSQFDLSFYFN
jgi:hypothetical protein